MEHPAEVKETKEDIFIIKIAGNFGIKNQASLDKFKKSCEADDNKRNIVRFLADPDKNPVECIFILSTGAESCAITMDVPPPEKLKKKGLAAMRHKAGHEILDTKNILKLISFIELNRNTLEHMYQCFHDVYAPIIQNPINQQGWSDLVTKDLMEKFNNFIAQIFVMIGLTKGRTMLPLPSHKLTTSDVTPDKDKAYAFESSIITWTKQIKNVLKLEPEMILKQEQDPGPQRELEFWESKADNLNSIYEQLQSTEVKNILRFLESNKSTYTGPFTKLQRDVVNARIEANDNYRHLKTLKRLFSDLSESTHEFSSIHELFIPIMHTILMIWKESKFYNTPPRLVVLIREICNQIISRAKEFVNGQIIFNIIKGDEVHEACDKLSITIDVCNKFKDAYFEYKGKAPDWKLTINAIFVRLDSFLERCHDILHFTMTLLQFKKLQDIQLGGTKGKTLTETVAQIYTEFEQAVNQFQEVQYDIMDIDISEFDKDFQEFRNKIKELERRLASVITQAFDDSNTIYGRFKILESFEALLTRPIIQDELEKKHIVLLEQYKQDLKIVQSLFLEGKKLIDEMHENAPIYNNMPPITGALQFCYSLRERIREPLEKLSNLGQVIIEREEYKDVQKLFASIKKQIEDYENSKILIWEEEVHQNSANKLQLTLLVKDEETGLLKVNFDPFLVRLLREVKYFQLSQRQVPTQASDIFTKNQIYRSQTVALEQIVTNYNWIINCLHPVEEPLIKERIEKMDEGLKPGMTEIQWKSGNIQEFIEGTQGLVESIYEIVKKMKECVVKIQESLNKINQPILERKARPMAPDDYDQLHKAVFQNKQMMLKESSSSIHKLMKEVSDAVKIDKKSPSWKSYTDYINEIVLEGISLAIRTALAHLQEQINPELQKPDWQPIFEIKLELSDDDIGYDPAIEENGQMSVKGSVKSWINDFFQLSQFISRLDKQDPSDFLQEIRDNFELKAVISEIFNHLNWIVQQTSEFKETFQKYSDFWKINSKDQFEKFLEENSEFDDVSKLLEESEDSLKDNPLLYGCRIKIPKLDLFDQKIAGFSALMIELGRITELKDIAWIRINLSQMKRQLKKKVSEWQAVYTNFLVKQVKQTLENLTHFNQITNDGIKKNPAEPENIHNKKLLMNVMKTIRDVKDVEPTSEAIIKRLKEMILKLKKHQISISDKKEEDPLQIIDNAFTQFKETTGKVFERQTQITQLQFEETQNIKGRLDVFMKQVKEFRTEFLEKLPYAYTPYNAFEQIESAYKEIWIYKQKLLKKEEEAAEYNKLERLFALEKTIYKELRDCNTDLKFLKIMWDSIALVNYQFYDWKNKSWKDIKADLFLEQNKILGVQLKSLPKEVKNFTKAYPIIVDQVKNMGTVLPLVSSLHSEYMLKRHWDALQKITHKEFDPTSGQFSFEDILGLELYRYENQVNEQVDLAQKEAKIEKKLKNIETNWEKQIFQFEETQDTKIFQSFDDVLELLDQNSMDLMGMKSQGKYVEFFLPRVDDWRNKLTTVQSVVDEWLKVQKNWKVLVNIFMNSEDIKSQLPEDTKVFEGVDTQFREMMNDVALNPKIVESCSIDRFDTLQQMSASIKRCEKSLFDYLEQKKKAFPRFYFLSNQSLLTILSNGTNPPKVCEYLGDCFEGLKYLTFQQTASPADIAKTAIGMISKDGEKIKFSSLFVCDGAVENYLLNLERKMRETLEEILCQAKASSEFWETESPREIWIKDYCAQLALLTTQIVWQEDVTRAFEDLTSGSDSAIKDCLEMIKGRIEKLILRIATELPYLERLKIINIITIDVHSRDVVDKLNRLKVQDTESFQWQQQLKFYWENKADLDMSQKQRLRFEWEKDRTKNKCIVKIVDWFRFYSYEYVGNSLRLVVTPLTDRCYITLTQALNLMLGGAPAGPAGTGKTETTKDLGRSVGLPVMVFNCSDQMNKESMSQIFMGLSQSGAWGCFDEFNRISIEVLSVVSSQVKCVLDALKEKKAKFLFMEEVEIQLIDTVGYFITMNPGYAGRTELPDNLKALFRSCAMVVPDIELICENMLMSEGFITAKALSKKFVTLYDLSKELLSKQRHYDWGLRAVKSVLRQAGKLKRSDTTIPEDPLLMRALRDFNMPKIVTDDIQIFLRLIDDLFPGVTIESKQDPDLQKKVAEAARNDLGLQTDVQQFVIKVVQLTEILEVRHCMFVIGPSGCGKTTVWKTAAKTLCNMGEECVYESLNPKGVTSDELFGCWTKSKEWKNGVLSMIMKNQSKNEGEYKEYHKHKWIILDGDVDPEWIESLNTVMDDNKVLTLVSNDRIPLTNEMRLLFEVGNLKNATPATVSRGGVLFINESDIGWQPYMTSWIYRTFDKVKEKQNEDVVDKYKAPEIDDMGKGLFLRCFESLENLEINKYKRVAPVVDIMLIQTICTILDALLIKFGNDIKALNDDSQKQAYEALFQFAGMWAIGGSLEDEKDLKQFNQIWRVSSKVKFPEVGLTFDYYYDCAKSAWTPWQNEVANYEPTDDVVFNKIYVPTLQTTRLRALLDYHVKRFRSVLFVGSAGTGKTAVMKDYLASCDPEQVQSRTLNFNSFTDSLALQTNIKTMVQKKTGRTYGSTANKVLICFIDDMNMPYVDKYGTQSPIALLRQIFDYGILFNREQLEEREFLQDLLFMGSLNPKSGSFTINLRLQRHYSMFTFFQPDADTIKTIYGSILEGHLKFFEEKIGKLTSKLIDSTIQVYKRVANDPKFSPTAKKFHYQFNLRELSKVIEGLCLTAPLTHNKGGPEQFIKLWVHETKRVFEDRMVATEDIVLLKQYIKESLVKNFPEQNPDLLEEKENIWTTFIAIQLGNEPAYMPIVDLAELKKVLDEKLEEYNEMKARMDLVLFEEAMQHVCKICRIMEFPVGNALLVGVGGSGKQSLSRLAAYILSYDVEQLVVTQSFGQADLKAFLQEMYKKVAKPGSTPRVFMITDSQIKLESFLIPINDILSLGWVNDLFPKEDVDGMVSSLRNECKTNCPNIGNNPTPEQLQDYFLDKVRKNLKNVLCFSPVGENFRIKSRKFPGLINGTSIDWFHSWPKDALINVASKFIQDLTIGTADSQATLEQIALNMAECHTSIDRANSEFLKRERRFNYTTPKSFLELISFYKKILSEKQQQIDKKIERFNNGLSILAETQSKVQGLQEELQLKMVEVQEKKQLSDELIEKVGQENAIAEEQQAIANEEAEKTNVATQEANKLKDTADKALEEALPAYEEAKAAISCLKKSTISEMKALGAPPRLVIITAKIVMILLGEKIVLTEPEEKTWKRAQNFMNNPIKFMESIGKFTGEYIEEEILSNAQKIQDDPEMQTGFNFEKMMLKNQAAAYLCKWTLNILKYNGIYKKIKPLMEEKERATQELEVKQKDLQVIQDKVAALNQKVALLRRNLEEKEIEKKKVVDEAERCSQKLSFAEKLVNGLAGENKRWGISVQILKANILSTIGDCLLAAEFVSYIGAFSSSFRLNLWKNTWIKDIIDRSIPMTDEITPLKILTTEAEMATWKNENLPSDLMSLENATIITSCSRWPLLIDPQLQGSLWIKTSQGENLQVISVTQDKWLNKLNNAIQMGKFVMIEGIMQEIDATLDPLLSRQFKKRGNSYILELGGQELDYDPKFKLYLLTKLFNPHFRPEIAAQCTIINFIVTEGGLEDQLLALVVKIEKNELEEMKQDLVKKQNMFLKVLDELEQNLLNTLSSANPETILENKDLINNLDNTKQTANDIELQREQASKAEIEINQQRELYRSVAAEGAMLYFLIIQLNIVDHMYQYSLDSFINFFRKAIDRVPVQDDTRVEALRQGIRYTIYQWVSRGLFERHKLILLTLITFRLMQKKVIDITYEPAQMDFLIKCIGRPSMNPLDWLPNQAWEAVQGLIQLEDFHNFAQNMEKDAPSRFKDWYNDLAPENTKLPLDWKKLDQQPFQKLLVLRCLRPDRITVALTQFIREALPNGSSFVEMDQKSFTEILESSIEDSDPSIPLFFILSSGSDPVKEVEKVAKKRKIESGKSFFTLALGQGQADIAQLRITQGNKEGHWVMLQNIHLMPSWLPELEKILDQFAQESGAGNAQFRLFLSAEPSLNVPIAILDRSIKLTNEPPTGLKANMKRAWTYFSRDEIEDKDPKVKQILFALCFFHSTVIERRRFGSIGWNMFYPFNIGDLRDSSLVLNKYMESNQGGKVPFEDLIYIFGEIMYGGHIVDDWDRKLCLGYLDNIMDEKLFDEYELFPFIDPKSGLSFRVPAPNTYEKFYEHIETNLNSANESPLYYGLHPNTEIGFSTTQCNTLFSTLIELQPKDTAGDDAGSIRTPQEMATDFMKILFDDYEFKNKIFNIEDTKTKLDAENRGPYQNVFLQELEYMNSLIYEINHSLEEIDLGFQGQLTISEKMEEIIDSISLNRIPKSWQALAYPSKRGLQSWVINLVARWSQLDQFNSDPLNIPKVIQISRFFNPQSFLTAIKQVIGQKNQWELNKIYISTEFIKKTTEEIDQVAKEGAYVIGFILEGARFDIQSGTLEESKPKEMFCPLPVCYCKALQLQDTSAVREDKSIYLCPCYKIEQRQGTFVFTGQLKTRAHPRKWILAGVAMLLDVEGVEDIKKK